MNETPEEVGAYIAGLNAGYSSGTASAAYLLCDRHPLDAIAATLIAADLTSHDVTYGALKVRSQRLAAALSDLGLKPGDRIATLMGKSEAYLVSVLAIWRLGAVQVPLFTAFAPPAIAYRLRASDCSTVICDAGQAPKLADAEIANTIIVAAKEVGRNLDFETLLARGEVGFPAAALGGEAPIIQIYTSGTTGTPKAVRVPLRALTSLETYLTFGLDVQSDDTYWNAADPGWAYGLFYAVVAPLARGVRTLLLCTGFSPQLTFDVLERFEVTNFTAAPTVYRALRASGMTPAKSLRCASSAGEPLTPEVNEWAVGALGVAVHDHYGQTEIGMVLNNHQHPTLRHPLKTGSMGRAMPGWAAQVLKTDEDAPAAPGEIGRLALDLSQSPSAWFAGYVDDSAKTAEKYAGGGRWYVTGDVARIDADGDVFFASRDDDVIIMAGYRIGPFEVESVIATHPSVEECAVVAVPDAVRGEVLEAVVVLRQGHVPSDTLTAEIQAKVKTGFAAHAYPRRVHYVAVLPKTPSGKIQRFEVRRQLRVGATV
jgi:acetyl-CoA synthetase